MSAITVRAITPEQHRDWIQGRPSVSFLQTPAWGEVKSGWSHQSVGWFEGSRLVGAGLVLYRSIPKLKQRSLAYIPEGPDVNWLGTTTVDEWLSPLVEHVRRHGAFQLKLGPQVVTRIWDAATVKTGIADGARKVGDIPADVTNEFAIALGDTLRASGWTQPETSGAGFGDVQPRYVFQVPLGGKTDEELLAGFNQLWRRNIKKADKAGVEVSIGTVDELPLFHEVYVETAARDHFTPRGLPYFQKMFSVMNAEDPNRVKLYLARHEGRVVAATTMVTVGTHAWYSYGASTTADREVRPSNAIQWRMMRDARDAGCTTYDLRGISDTLDPDDHLFGLIQFKLGTGGQAVEYLGEWDYVIRKPWAKAFELYMSRKG